MIYLDSAATTPPNSEVLDTYIKVNESFWANPHSLHKIGERAEQLLEQARTQVTQLLDGEGYRAIFTSGATESSNLAIKGTAQLLNARGKHIIITNSEHPSVSETANWLETQGFTITRLPVNEYGVITVDQVEEALTDETLLVSTIWVNNESGAVTPINEIGTLLKEHRALYHIDAVQGVGKLPFSLNETNADLISLSAHKFNGLKGSGVLIHRELNPFGPLFHGGGQEFNLRSGTADVPRAAAFAKALRLALADKDDTYQKVLQLNTLLRDSIKAVPGVILNSPETASPYILNCSVEGVRPETILHGLVQEEIYISTVSACSSKKTERSEVIFAMTNDDDRARSSIRISLSSATTEEEINRFISTFTTTITNLR